MPTLSALSLRVVQPPALPQIGLRLLLLAAFTLPAYANVIIPSSFGHAMRRKHIIQSSASRLPLTLSSIRTPERPLVLVKAIVDAAGAHLTLSGSASGEGDIQTTAYVGFR
jgi:hypothetical protein